VQIVNGLQTTESIFRHFATGRAESRQRALLVKVIVSNDNVIRDQIIRATNNQSIVEVASLHATDKIQRDIEEVLERSGWFYERRKNYYRNIGKPEARFVTPMYIAAGCVALVLRNPAMAARLKSRFMRIPESYAAVFSEELPLNVWPVIAEVVKRAEEVLQEVRPVGGGKGERFLANWRNLLGLLVVSRMFGTFAYSTSDLATLETSKITKEMMLETWQFLNSSRRTQHDHWDHVSNAEYHCIQAAAKYGLAGIQIIGKRHLAASVPKEISLSEDFIDLVDGALPPQPWKPKVHRAVATQLNCRPAKVSAAINKLVERGKWMAQRGGIVYDVNGVVVAVDSERVQAQPVENGDRTKDE
jgi:AIPR protein